jgi:hypothetical protein
MEAQKLLKKEVLKGLRNLKIDCMDFEHCLEDSQFTYASKMYSFETPNYLIEIDLTECLIWYGYDHSEVYSLDLDDIKVFNQEGEINIDFITDDEILNSLNY